MTLPACLRNPMILHDPRPRNTFVVIFHGRAVLKGSRATVLVQLDRPINVGGEIYDGRLVCLGSRMVVDAALLKSAMETGLLSATILSEHAETI